MWPFWRRRSDDDRIRQALSEHLSKEIIDDILKSSAPSDSTLQDWTSHFILLQVREDDLRSMTANLNEALDIVVRREGVVCGILSSMILVTFGLPLVDDDASKARDQQAKCVARLVTELGSNVRLVYGAADGLVGTVGSARQTLRGLFLPRFATQIETLLALEFGKSVEM